MVILFFFFTAIIGAEVYILRLPGDFPQKVPGLVVGVILLLIVIYAMILRSTTKKKSASEAYSVPPAAIQPPPQRTAPQPPAVTVPSMIDGKACAYHYENVSMLPLPGLALEPLIGQKITFVPEGDSVTIYCQSKPIGYMKPGTLSRMVVDWTNKQDPNFAVLTHIDDLNQEAAFDLFFYRDELAYQLSKDPDAKRYRLIGNRSGEMQDQAGCCVTGQLCSLEYDFDKEKYMVLADGLEIGYLPTPAEKIVQQEGEEYVKVIVADTSIDDEFKTVVLVYVFS